MCIYILWIKVKAQRDWKAWPEFTISIPEIGLGIPTFFKQGPVVGTLGWKAKPWEREIICGHLNLLLLILHLSSHSPSLLCAFAVPPIKLQNAFPCPSLLDSIIWLFGQWNISGLTHCYLCFCLENFLGVASASSSLAGEQEHMGQYCSGSSVKQSLCSVRRQTDKKYMLLSVCY